MDIYPIETPVMTIWGMPFSFRIDQIGVDEQAVEQILQIDCLPKSKPAYDGLRHIVGKTSLVAIEGDRWKKLRKMFNPAFAPSHIETFIPIIVDESLIFIDKLNHVADTGDVVQMNMMTTVCDVLFNVLNTESYHRYHRKVWPPTTDIDVLRVVFGIKFNTQEAPMEMVDALSRLIVDSYVITPVEKIAKAIDPMRYYKVWNDERYCLPNTSSS